MNLKNKNAQIAMMLSIISMSGSLKGMENSSVCIQEICAPQVDCCSCRCGHFFVDAELLVLRANEGGLSNVCDGTVITDSTSGGITISRLEGSSEDPDFNWDVGFRVGAGYEFADNCTLGVYWLHYNSDTSSELQNWNIDFNVVDVLYGCDCSSWRCFSVIPFGGIRFASIDQNLRGDFINSENGSITSTSGNIKETFWGVGPLIGIEGDWRIGCGYSLYGDVAVSFLYGKFRVASNQTTTFASFINIDRLNSDLQAFQPVVDFGFGVRWMTCFCCDKQFWLQLGFEQHSYFNQNQFCGYGDLNVYGFSIGSGVIF